MGRIIATFQPCAMRLRVERGAFRDPFADRGSRHFASITAPLTRRAQVAHPALLALCPRGSLPKEDAGGWAAKEQQLSGNTGRFNRQGFLDTCRKEPGSKAASRPAKSQQGARINPSAGIRATPPPMGGTGQGGRTAREEERGVHAANPLKLNRSNAKGSPVMSQRAAYQDAGRTPFAA